MNSADCCCASARMATCKRPSAIVIGWLTESTMALCRNGAQKLLGVLITIGEAVAYVVSGMYGDVRELGAGNAILIIVQVCSCAR